MRNSHESTTLRVLVAARVLLAWPCTRLADSSSRGARWQGCRSARPFTNDTRCASLPPSLAHSLCSASSTANAQLQPRQNWRSDEKFWQTEKETSCNKVTALEAGSCPVCGPSPEREREDRKERKKGREKTWRGRRERERRGSLITNLVAAMALCRRARTHYCRQACVHTHVVRQAMDEALSCCPASGLKLHSLAKRFIQSFHLITETAFFQLRCVSLYNVLLFHWIDQSGKSFGPLQKSHVNFMCHDSHVNFTL